MKFILAALLLVPTLATTQPQLEPSALAGMVGHWSGTLIYMDYSNGAETHIPATLTVEALDERSWCTAFSYPDEPGSNEVDTVVLAADGHVLDSMVINEVDTLGDGALRITLEQDGEDKDAPARIRKVWTIGTSSLELRKEVGPVDGGAYRLRHVYRFAR